MKKLAVFFPGIGYTVDKPLLHYSRKLVADAGYEVKLLPYSGFPQKVKGDRDKMLESYRIALAQSEEMLSDFDLSPRERSEILIQASQVINDADAMDSMLFELNDMPRAISVETIMRLMAEGNICAQKEESHAM